MSRSSGVRRWMPAAGLAAVLLAAGCAVDAGPAGAPTAAPGSAASGPSAVAAPVSAASGPSAVASPVPAGGVGPGASPDPVRVPEALRFTGTTLDGAAFPAAALAGRPVVLWFWAPWCATCASQAWTVAEIAPRYRDTVPIVGVAGLGERAAMRDFVAEFDLAGTPQLDDREGALWRRFKVVEQSTFVVLDRNGRIIHQGFLDGESLTRRVAELAG
ncbi:TlpA disulfide reductase family protein [Micromonospora sp. NPDC050686]|uniref:TlpA family protein disulfide reductase n=1 Tax=Micromonospora sp. NPDC050686 TaxID=3154631 RepID=UPI0033C60CCD